jgi:hypothetical protein
LRFQRFTRAGGTRKISWQPMPFGLRASGFKAARISSGAITVRDQYDTFHMFTGNQRGISMSSTGMAGTARHGTWPNRASV